jgi:hypothetical protein
MSPVAAAAGAGVLAGTVLAVAVLAAWARAHYARRLPSFRCRIGPAGGRRRGRWRVRRSWAIWVGDVLLVRSGAFRQWLTPLHAGVAPDATIRVLGRGEVRGLGRHPVALRLTLPDAGELELAVAAENADLLVGPFLTAALSGVPDAPRERGG